MSRRTPQFGKPDRRAHQRYRGPVAITVQAVSRSTARSGQAHIAVSFGSLHFEIEGWEALDALIRAASHAAAFAGHVFDAVPERLDLSELEQFRRRSS